MRSSRYAAERDLDRKEKRRKSGGAWKGRVERLKLALAGFRMTSAGTWGAGQFDGADVIMEYWS